MQERRFVVEVREPVPAARVPDVAASVAERFGMDPGRLHKLLAGRTGPVTKPVLEAKADLIARAFTEAGVAVTVYLAEDDESDDDMTGASTMGELDDAVADPALFGSDVREVTPTAMFLSSTRWVPSPHEAADPADLGRGDDADPEPVRDAWSPPSATPAAPRRIPVARPPRSGTGLRTYLLVGFVASLALLLVLQAINGMSAGRTRGTASVEAGMRAYGDGDFAQAARLWTPLARAGDPRAQYMLGYMAENGQGRPWSNHDAAAWYRLAANQGYPQAQVGLGELYLRGMGVPRDPGVGAQLFRQAAEEGYGQGQFQYALALFRGTGVAQDFASALHWFRQAAANGVAEAQPYVGFAGSAARTASDGASGP